MIKIIAFNDSNQQKVKELSTINIGKLFLGFEIMDKIMKVIVFKDKIIFTEKKQILHIYKEKQIKIIIKDIK